MNFRGLSKKWPKWSKMSTLRNTHFGHFCDMSKPTEFNFVKMKWQSYKKCVFWGWPKKWPKSAIFCHFSVRRFLTIPRSGFLDPVFDPFLTQNGTFLSTFFHLFLTFEIIHGSKPEGLWKVGDSKKWSKGGFWTTFGPLFWGPRLQNCKGAGIIYLRQGLIMRSKKWPKSDFLSFFGVTFWGS